MFNTYENDYIKSLVNTYYGKGYKHYVVHTVTDNNQDYDMVLYVSKNEIQAVTDNYFFVQDGLRIYIDSSSKSNYSYNDRDKVSSFNGYITVDQAEFIYTNALAEYSYSSIPVNPDILVDYSQSQMFIGVIMMLAVMFLYIFISDIMNIGGKK